jgi:hypothetical protein
VTEDKSVPGARKESEVFTSKMIKDAKGNLLQADAEALVNSGKKWGQAGFSIATGAVKTVSDVVYCINKIENSHG